MECRGDATRVTCNVRYILWSLVISHDLMIDLYCFFYLASCHIDALFRYIITAICMNYNAVLVFYIYSTFLVENNNRTCYNLLKLYHDIYTISVLDN